MAVPQTLDRKVVQEAPGRALRPWSAIGFAAIAAFFVAFATVVAVAGDIWLWLIAAVALSTASRFILGAVTHWSGREFENVPWRGRNLAITVLLLVAVVGVMAPLRLTGAAKELWVALYAGALAFVLVILGTIGLSAGATRR